MAEDLGFEMIGSPEHFLHTEGLEFGSVPAAVRVHRGPDQTGQGRPRGLRPAGMEPATAGGYDRVAGPSHQGTHLRGTGGYQTRWVNPMAQKLHVQATGGKTVPEIRSTGSSA